MIDHRALSRFVYETGSPFKRLDALLADVPPNPAREPIVMTVGSPRHDPPKAVAQTLAADLQGLRAYPAITGTPDHRQAIAQWLTRRYALPSGFIDPQQHILALNGSREGLTFAARCARDLKPGADRPLILMQNPFYQAYTAGALMAGCEVVLLEEADITGDAVPKADLDRTVAAFIASPTNPQGVVLSRSDWAGWIDKARTHGFFLFADECYSEIYRAAPPPGVLEVARDQNDLSRIVSFNSLSKRSNLPGLRSGFAAGDPAFIGPFMKLRNLGGPQVPVPLQNVAAMAWSDETHVEESRTRYARKWAMVDKRLGAHLTEPLPEAGFFLWLKLPDGLRDTDVAVGLWRDQALKTLPGSFMTYPHPDASAGNDRLRVALVTDEATTAEALERLATLFDRHDTTD